MIWQHTIGETGVLAALGRISGDILVGVPVDMETMFGLPKNTKIQECVKSVKMTNEVLKWFQMK